MNSDLRRSASTPRSIWIYFIIGSALIIAAWYFAARNPEPARAVTAEVAGWFTVDRTPVPPLMQPITATKSITAFTILDGSEFDYEGSNVSKGEVGNRVTLQGITKGKAVPFSSLGPQLDANTTYNIISVPAINVPVAVNPGTRITAIVSSSSGMVNASTPTTAGENNIDVSPAGMGVVCTLRDVVVLSRPESQPEGTYRLFMAVPASSINDALPQCFTDESVVFPIVSLTK